jgi:SAM-dependent methyltransferase
MAVVPFKRLIKNAGRPSDTFWGRLMLAGMNRGHQKMALWCIDTCMDLSGSEDVLDIGCGGGQNIANFLKRTGGKVYGMDYSPTSVAKSLKKNKRAVAGKRAVIVQADVAAIPFENSAFDVAIAFETIYFWEDIIAGFKEAKRVLKPNGKFVVCNEASKMEGHEHLLDILDMRIYTVEEITEAMRQAGFADVQAYRRDNTQHICVIGRRRPGGHDDRGRRQ